MNAHSYVSQRNETDVIAGFFIRSRTKSLNSQLEPRRLS